MESRELLAVRVYICPCPQRDTILEIFRTHEGTERFSDKDDMHGWRFLIFKRDGVGRDEEQVEKHMDSIGWAVWWLCRTALQCYIQPVKLTCHSCGGSGKRVGKKRISRRPVEETCSKCNGTGEAVCEWCSGADVRCPLCGTKNGKA